MPYELYKWIHISSIGLLLVSLAALLQWVKLGNDHKQNPHKKLLSIVHGIAMTLLIVSGFGLLARLGVHNMPLWVIGKLVIWLLFGLSMLALKRFTKLSGKVFWALCVLLSIAAYLAVYKPS